MPETKGLALVAMLHDEFALVTDILTSEQPEIEATHSSVEAQPNVGGLPDALKGSGNGKQSKGVTS